MRVVKVGMTRAWNSLGIVSVRIWGLHQGVRKLMRISSTGRVKKILTICDDVVPVSIEATEQDSRERKTSEGSFLIEENSEDLESSYNAQQDKGDTTVQDEMENASEVGESNTSAFENVVAS